MVTLTYHHTPPADVFQRHFGAIFSWWRDFSPGSPAVFRVEFQARGCPHLHVLVETKPENVHFHGAWLRITGQQSDKDAVAHAVHIGPPYREQDKPGDALMAYVAGHSSKAGYQSTAPPGYRVVQWYRSLNLIEQDGEQALVATAELRRAMAAVAWLDKPVSWGGWLGGPPADELLLSPRTAMVGELRLDDGRYFAGFDAGAVSALDELQLTWEIHGKG